MRTYNVKNNAGGVPDTISPVKMGAGEQNSIFLENSSAVTRSGLTPADAAGTSEDTTQLAQSLFLHGAKSQTFNDSGIANQIVLSPVSGPSGVLLPVNYDNMSGVRAVFIPSANNTGATTISIGQSTAGQLGTKAALHIDGTQLNADDIVSTQYSDFVYSSTADGGNGAWLYVTVAVVPDDPEFIRDTMSATLVGGNDVTIVTDDVADTITINANVPEDPEFIRDTMSATLVGGTDITIVTDDVADTITISSDAISSVLPAGYMAGYEMTIGPIDTLHDITVMAGSARDSTNTFDLMGELLTKQIDGNWAIGNAGGRFPGVTLTANRVYYFFAIRRDSDGLVDYGFDSVPIPTHLPVGFSNWRFLSRVTTNGASNLQNSMQGQFLSGPLTIGSARLSVNHGLGTNDVFIQTFLQATRSANGYTTGERIAVNQGLSSTRGLSMQITNTQAIMRFSDEGSSFKIVNGNDGDTEDMVTGAWRFYVHMTAKTPGVNVVNASSSAAAAGSGGDNGNTGGGNTGGGSGGNNGNTGGGTNEGGEIGG
jgi:hypothetical protein